MLLLPLLHMTDAPALPALRCYYSAPTALSPSLCLSQLPAANSPTCLTLDYLYDCGSTISLLAADAAAAAARALPDLRYTIDYLYSFDKRLSLPSQRNG
jgi:hypothetical protein